MGGDGMLIRTARAEDAAEIQRIYKAGRGVETIVGVDYGEEDWRAFVESPQSILLVAEEEGRTAGFLTGYDMRTWGYVDALVVDRESRGRGLGLALLQRFEGHGSGRWGFVELCVDVKDRDTMRYVAARGFRSSGRAEWFVKGLGRGMET